MDICAKNGYLSGACHYLNRDEISENLDLLRKMLGQGEPRLVQNGKLGTFALTKEKNKIFFAGLSVNEVQKILNHLAPSQDNVGERKYEFIIHFESHHAGAVLQNYDNTDVNNDYYYRLDFHSGSLIRHYLSTLVPMPCKTSVVKEKGKFLANGQMNAQANIINKIYHSLHDDLKRSFAGQDLYLIFKITDNEFVNLEQKLFNIEQQCKNGEIVYSAHGLYPKSYNCFTALNILADELKLAHNVFHYFLAEQLNVAAQPAKKLALIYSRDVSLIDYWEFLLSLKHYIRIGEDQPIAVKESVLPYKLINCDAVKEDKMNYDTCSYANICVLTDDHKHIKCEGPLSYNDEGEYFSRSLEYTVHHSSELVRQHNVSIIYKIDADHPICDL